MKAAEKKAAVDDRYAIGKDHFGRQAHVRAGRAGRAAVQPPGHVLSGPEGSGQHPSGEPYVARKRSAVKARTLAWRHKRPAPLARKRSPCGTETMARAASVR
ncbi:MAG: hypothetical protein KAJ55_16370 [Anaerolineales bacterium]|nr:hypothetical protein [Anaerolineales bacterium]